MRFSLTLRWIGGTFQSRLVQIIPLAALENAAYPKSQKSIYKLKQSKNFDYKLVISGKRGWLYDDLFRRIKELKVENLIFTNHIPEEDLPALYSGAELFVYPSIYEGFGLPPLEAMACGTPVVTSNTSSLPEVVGDAGILVSPKDTEALAQAMTKVLSDQTLQEKMVSKGLERAKIFSWEKTARETLEVYRSVVG